MTIQFQEFPKIPRYRREVALTEKLDGTNGAVAWHPYDGSFPAPDLITCRAIKDQHGNDLGNHGLFAQSRGRFITPSSVKPKNDNYGFAQWVADHADDLMTLGTGIHYGEWWGYGIQRGYGMAEKHFSLFNVNRWGDGKQKRPACCDVVPLIAYATPDTIHSYVEGLRLHGSLAAPGYMKPEGIVVWHSQSKQYYKILLENDDVPKSIVKT